MIKQTLIKKLGGTLMLASGLAGLVGCESPQGNKNISPYSQSQTYEQQSQNNGNLEFALLGGLLGASSNPIAKGIGGAMVASATKPQSNVNVNVNQPSQPQVVYVPAPQPVDERLLPEYDLAQLENELRSKDTNSFFREGIYSVFTANHCFDLKGDGKCQSPVGTKRNFKKEEPANLYICIVRNRGVFQGPKSKYDISVEIKDVQGELIKKLQDTYTLEGNYSILELNISNLKPGIYTAACTYSNGNVKKQRNAVFQLLEDK